MGNESSCWFAESKNSAGGHDNAGVVYAGAVLEIASLTKENTYMRSLRGYFFCVLLLTPALGCAQKALVPKDNETSPQVGAHIEYITAEKNKKVFEFVEINGEKYPVPKSWRGRKIVESPPLISQLEQIPQEYTHKQSKLYVERTTRDAFVKMAEKAAQDGVQLLAHSGYRSVRYQRKIFSTLIAEGRTWEDLVRYVAPPGYSQHMLGRSIDMYPSNWKFASTPEYNWLKAHGAAFGFTETYPEVNADGFPWEAWHWQFNGVSDEVSAENVNPQDE